MARTVLVVDDEPLILELTAEMLKDLGCDVVTAANATEALAKLKTDSRIEILITDINMPGMTGYQLAQKAKERRSDLRVLMLSGRETDGHGFPMIRKPFMQEDLARALKHTTGLC
jgi:two-component system cell cycle response regulator CpdR